MYLYVYVEIEKQQTLIVYDILDILKYYPERFW